jgi:tryptophan halogenase
MRKIVIAGSGTAGLISALMLRKAFPLHQIEVISSSKIGIIGVGEGSTEHWRSFMEICDIPVGELIVKTRATHKYGIRFENWTNHTPDYFHSVSYAGTNEPFGYYGLYNGLIQDGKTLTENISSRSMVENKVYADNPHNSTNQYHFDTFHLNEYLTSLCLFRSIKMVDAEIVDINLNPDNGYIESVKLDTTEVVESDFWIDATGMKRLLMSKISDVKWESFDKYLQMDSAIAFPTPSDPSGEIRPYTRARAMPNGWVWEIPTQDRRGNGYVFSSSHCTDDQAVKEVSSLMGFEVEPAKIIKFNPGHVKEFWVKNCVAVGLAGAFVEPIEATSIGSTIQQIRCLIQNLCVYDVNSKKIQKEYNRKMNIMMENILAMISLHYISDRDDTEMWKTQKSMPIPDYLSNLIELWKERPIFPYDISHNNYEMFHSAHFAHVAQGQKIFTPSKSRIMIENFNAVEEVKKQVWDAKLAQTGHAKVDHAESLRQIQI